MTDPTARDLIQRLADELEGEIKHKVGWGEPDYADELINEARAYLATPEPNPDLNLWREAVIDALVCNFILTEQNSNDPRKAVSDLIAWEHQLATDPLVASVPELENHQ